MSHEPVAASVLEDDDIFTAALSPTPPSIPAPRSHVRTCPVLEAALVLTSPEERRNGTDEHVQLVFSEDEHIGHSANLQVIKVGAAVSLLLVTTGKDFVIDAQPVMTVPSSALEQVVSAQLNSDGLT